MARDVPCLLRIGSIGKLRQHLPIIGDAKEDLAVTAATNLAQLPPTLPLWPSSTNPDEPAAASILGMGRSTAFALAKAGEFPVRLLRVGTKYRVSRADLLRYLGETPSGGQAA
jgi:excisionase family DNA binding protein